jgi:hypothetical protein
MNLEKAAKLGGHGGHGEYGEKTRACHRLCFHPMGEFYDRL